MDETGADKQMEVTEADKGDEEKAPLQENGQEKPPAPAMKISFGVKKKAESLVRAEAVQLVSNAEAEAESDEDEVQEVEAKRRKLTHFEDGMFPEDEVDRRRKAKLEMVIPMVQERDWRVAKLIEQRDNGTISDEDRARIELLLQNDPLIAQENGTGSGEAIVVDTLKTINNVDADYSQVPIESFGLAVLRGCGWREGEGIGKTNKQVVPLRVLEGRPKGLGLGAKPKKQDDGKQKSGVGSKDPNEEVPKELRKGVHVKILQGPNRDTYGTVESRDDDNASVFVRLALKGTAVRVSLYGLEAVSKKEFERDGKCLNKRDYDKEKARIEERNGRSERDSKKESKRDKDKEYDKDKKGDWSEERRKEELWARIDLVVRFIDKKYNGGDYFGEKMRIVDVADRKNVTLVDGRGKQHYSESISAVTNFVAIADIKQSWLETVIPRDASEKVLILRGRHAGAAATVEEKYKSNARLLARILRSDELVEVSYDDVCHYRPAMDDGEE